MSPSLVQLIDALSDPAVYGQAEPVVVHQTHISVVFVAGERAYKLKKPLELGFVDYSTPQRRRAFCEAEVRLNERLAPHVYQGVRSVVPHPDGGFRYGDPDDPAAIDWVVEMTRLYERDNFLSHLHAGTIEPQWLVELGRKMAAFHQTCARGEPGAYGALETVARNARENFSQAEDQIGRTVSRPVFDAARAATDAQLDALEALITARDETGHTCDTHGDLRLEHVYRIDGELVVVDCIEFNDAFRYADPVADVAFLAMDLRIRWADELARVFTDTYFDALPGGESLLDFYVAYRSAVRAKVHGMASAEPEIDEAKRSRSFAKSRGHWLFTWSTLAPPVRRPAIVLVGGLPGTGKSTLARTLAEHAAFECIDSDHVRKELAGVAPTDSMRAELDAGIYTPEWSRKTYAECLARAMTAVSEGGRVVISATFRTESLRLDFLEAAHAMGVCGVLLVCELPRDEVVRRIEARTGDASDADIATYDHVASAWEAPGAFVEARLVTVSTASPETARRQALDALSAFGIFDSP